MARRTVSEVAQDVLRYVEAEELIKTAERTVFRGTLDPAMKSELAQEITKLATVCREVDDRVSVTYNDLRQLLQQARG